MCMLEVVHNQQMGFDCSEIMGIPYLHEFSKFLHCRTNEGHVFFHRWHLCCNCVFTFWSRNSCASIFLVLEMSLVNAQESNGFLAYIIQVEIFTRLHQRCNHSGIMNHILKLHLFWMGVKVIADVHSVLLFCMELNYNNPASAPVLYLQLVSAGAMAVDKVLKCCSLMESAAVAGRIVSIYCYFSLDHLNSLG